MNIEIEQKEKLKMLREPFPNNQISKLPKPTKKQTDLLRENFKNGIRCGVCGGWHHKDVIHLDYVGHAALTDRLLDCDPNWSWEPLAVNESGLPAFDQNGGMWIKLTVCGVTRLGYGDAQGKSGGDAIKECIGDALRNAAMRFGAALELWHKGELHKDNGDYSYVTSSYTDEQKEQYHTIFDSRDALAMWAFRRTAGDEVYSSLISTFQNGKKVKCKEAIREMEKEALSIIEDYKIGLKECIAQNDTLGLSELALPSLHPEIKKEIFNSLTPEEKANLEPMVKELKQAA